MQVASGVHDRLFSEVIAFIEGYTTGAYAKHARREWHGFNEWLSSKLGYPSYTVTTTYLRNTYLNDSQALSELARLYLEYAQEQKFDWLVEEAEPLP
ncbi:MAG: hypothetical protein ACRD6N_01150 [Pyrinomonadaceae bacterium]